MPNMAKKFTSTYIEKQGIYRKSRVKRKKKKIKNVYIIHKKEKPTSIYKKKVKFLYVLYIRKGPPI